MTKHDLIAALWELWARIDPQGVGQLSEFTEDEAAEVTKARLQALIDSDFGDRRKPSRMTQADDQKAREIAQEYGGRDSDNDGAAVAIAAAISTARAEGYRQGMEDAAEIAMSFSHGVGTHYHEGRCFIADDIADSIETKAKEA